jgi:DNA modification methylase
VVPVIETETIIAAVVHKKKLTNDYHQSINEAYKEVVRKPTTTATHCSCGAPFRRGIVLDPFMGSGTTAIVARALRRDYVGIELSPEYCEIAKKRLKDWSMEKVLEKLGEEIDYDDGMIQTKLD